MTEPTAATDSNPPRPLDARMPLRSPVFWLGFVVVVAMAFSLRLVSYQDIRDSPLLSDSPFLADSAYYDYRAKRIAGGDIWGQEVFFMAPLYEYTVAAVYALDGQSIDQPDFRLARQSYDIDPAIQVQCVYGALTCGLLFAMAYLWFGPIAGWAAGLMAAFYGPFIFFDGLLMAASLVLLTGVIAVALLTWADWKGRWWRWLIGGMATGLAVLAHGSTLAVLPVVVLILLLFPNQDRRTSIRSALSFAIGAMLLILPVTVRNYVVGNDWVLLTSNAGMNLFIGNNEYADGTHVVYQFPYPMTKLSDYYQRPRRGPDDPSPSFVSRRVGSQAVSWMASHPAATAGLWLTKFRFWFNHVELGIRDHYHFFRQFSEVLRAPLLGFGVIGPLGLTGAIFLRHRLRELRFVYAMLAVQTAVFVSMFVLGRYRFCATACLMLLGAGQIAWWVTKWRQQDIRAMAGSVVVLAVFAVLVHLPVAGFDENHAAAKLYANLGNRYLQEAVDAHDPSRLDDAIEAFGQAEQLDWGQTGLAVSRSLMLKRFGDAWLVKGDLDQALTYGQKALDEVERELTEPPADYAPVRTPPDTLVNRRDRVRRWMQGIEQSRAAQEAAP